MRNIISFFISYSLLLCCNNSFGQDLTMEWARHVGAPNDQVATAVTTDLNGNAYYTGYFEDTVDFDPGTGVETLSTNGRTVFISKLNAQGDFAWVKHFEGINNTGQQIGQGMAVKTDPWGNVYVAGYFGGKVNFEQITLTAHATDIFVAKMDSLGNVIWAKNMGGLGSAQAYGIDVDQYGNVYTTGETSGTIDFDPGPGVENLTAHGGADIFVSKLDSAGNYVWARNMGGKGQDVSWAISVDSFGNVYTSGNFSQTIDLDPDTINTFTITPGGSSEAFISKLDAMGNFVWGKSFAGLTSNSSTTSYTIKTDRFGNVFTAGLFYRSIDFNAGGNSSFTVTGPGSASHLYTAKLDSTGNLIWVKYSPGTANITPRSIDVDKQGNPYIAGWYNGTAELNPGSGTGDTFKVTAVKSTDIFVLKLDSAGTFQWANTYGGEGADYGYGISVGEKRNIYVAGYFNSNPINFDTLLNDANFTNRGKIDLFTFKLNQSCSDSSFARLEVEVCEDEYVYNDETFQESGVYTVVLMDDRGCDSIVTLRLFIKGAVQKPEITVNGFVLGTVPQSYASYQWYLNGEIMNGATDSTVTISENGHYSVVVTNEHGCEDTSDVYTVNNYTAIEGNNDIAGRINIFPNPLKDVVYINTPIKLNGTLSSIEGRVISSYESITRIDLSSLPQGIYLLRLTDKNGNLIKMEKLVKDR